MVRRQSHTNMNFMKNLSRNITRCDSWSALFSNRHPELFTSLQRKHDSTRTAACSVSQNQNTITESWRCYHLDSSQDVITQEDLAQGRRLIKCSPIGPELVKIEPLLRYLKSPGTILILLFWQKTHLLISYVVSCEAFFFFSATENIWSQSLHHWLLRAAPNGTCECVMRSGSNSCY